MPRNILLILCLVTVFLSQAAVPAGQWKLHTPFSGVDRVLATPEGYFFTSRGFLFFHSHDSSETVAMSTAGGLTGTEVEHIFYNPAGHYTAAVYTDGNIDLIDSRMRVTCLSDIRDAEVSGSRRINNLSFGPGRIYAATDFGIVVFDDKKMQVIESGIFNEPVNMFLKTADRYLINTGGEWLALDGSERINRRDKYTSLGNADAVTAAAIDGNRILSSGKNGVEILTFDFNDGSFTSAPLSSLKPRYLDPTGKNGLQFSADGRISATDPDGKLILNASLPAASAAFYSYPAEPAGASPSGLLKLKLEGNTATAVGEPVAPGEIAVKSVDYMAFDTDGTLYLKTVAPSRLFNGLAYGPTTIDRILNDGRVEHLEPVDAEYPKAPDGSFWSDNCLTNSLGLTLHPTEKGVFYTGNFVRGLYIHRDNRITAHADDSNSPLDRWWGTTVQHGAFDKWGNLWLLCNFRGNPLYRISSKDVLTPGSDSWERIDIPEFDTGHDARIIWCRKSNTLVAINSNSEGRTLFYDTRGTDTTSDDRFSTATEFTDRDGATHRFEWRTAVAEDREGRVWIGTDDGLIVIPDPAAMAADPMTPVTRVKVPRNDGTGLADYLLDNITVSCIAVDGADRKWIGTLTDGLYLVSPDGTEIISHFTRLNSPLPADCIHSVACHPSDGRVMIGTALGLLEYGGTASTPSDDFSSVTAYPNPVRPGSGGPVTIRGLIDRTLVKITDASGRLVAALRSEGGMAVWNCCNMSGQRVPAGVYYVFLSGGSDPESNPAGAVTKILVIN